MRIELVSCPRCNEFGSDEQCLGCMGRGCVPVEVDELNPEPADNAEQLVLYRAGQPSRAEFQRGCSLCEKPLGYIVHYVVFPLCKKCMDTVNEG